MNHSHSCGCSIVSPNRAAVKVTVQHPTIQARRRDSTITIPQASSALVAQWCTSAASPRRAESRHPTSAVGASSARAPRRRREPARAQGLRAGRPSTRAAAGWCLGPRRARRGLPGPPMCRGHCLPSSVASTQARPRDPGRDYGQSQGEPLAVPDRPEGQVLQPRHQDPISHRAVDEDVDGRQAPASPTRRFQWSPVRRREGSASATG